MISLVSLDTCQIFTAQHGDEICGFQVPQSGQMSYLGLLLCWIQIFRFPLNHFIYSYPPSTSYFFVLLWCLVLFWLHTQCLCVCVCYTLTERDTIAGEMFIFQAYIARGQRNFSDLFFLWFLLNGSNRWTYRVAPGKHCNATTAPLFCVCASALRQDAGEDKQNRKSVFSAIFREFHLRLSSSQCTVLSHSYALWCLHSWLNLLDFFSLVKHLLVRYFFNLSFTLVTLQTCCAAHFLSVQDTLFSRLWDQDNF